MEILSVLRRNDVKKIFPSRIPESHKGMNGRVLIIGGSADYYGAPILSAMGALNSGCDLVYLYVPECNFDVTRNAAPDFIVKNKELTEFTIKLRSNNLFYKFIRQLLDGNLKGVYEKYNGNLTQFSNYFDLSDDQINLFKNFCLKNGMEIDIISFNLDKNYIKKRLKAEIARNYWKKNGWYKILLDEDEQFLKARELLSKNFQIDNLTSIPELLFSTELFLPEILTEKIISYSAMNKKSVVDEYVNLSKKVLELVNNKDWQPAYDTLKTMLEHPGFNLTSEEERAQILLILALVSLKLSDSVPTASEDYVDCCERLKSEYGIDGYSEVEAFAKRLSV